MSVLLPIWMVYASADELIEAALWYQQDAAYLAAQAAARRDRAVSGWDRSMASDMQQAAARSAELARACMGVA